MSKLLTVEQTVEVGTRCICFRAQRAARALARRFDAAFRPFGIKQGQFSLMQTLNRPGVATMNSVAEFLSMDRTTLTAALKPLVRRELVSVTADPKDRRVRQLTLTRKGHSLLLDLMPIWRAEHDAVDRLILALEDDLDLEALRNGIGALGNADQTDRPTSEKGS